MEEDGDCATGKGVAATMKWSPAMEDAYQAALEHVGGLEAAKPKAVLELLQGQFPHLIIQNVKWHIAAHRRRVERHKAMVPANTAPPTKWFGRMEDLYEAEVARQGGLHAARPKALLDAMQEEFPDLTLQIVKWHLQGQRRAKQRRVQQPAAVPVEPGEGTSAADGGRTASLESGSVSGASTGRVVPSGRAGAPRQQQQQQPPSPQQPSPQQPPPQQTQPQQQQTQQQLQQQPQPQQPQTQRRGQQMQQQPRGVTLPSQEPVQPQTQQQQLVTLLRQQPQPQQGQLLSDSQQPVQLQALQAQQAAQRLQQQQQQQSASGQQWAQPLLPPQQEGAAFTVAQGMPAQQSPQQAQQDEYLHLVASMTQQGQQAQLVQQAQQVLQALQAQLAQQAQQAMLAQQAQLAQQALQALGLLQPPGQVHGSQPFSWLPWHAYLLSGATHELSESKKMLRVARQLEATLQQQAEHLNMILVSLANHQPLQGAAGEVLRCYQARGGSRGQTGADELMLRGLLDLMLAAREGGSGSSGGSGQQALQFATGGSAAARGGAAASRWAADGMEGLPVSMQRQHRIVAALTAAFPVSSERGHGGEGGAGAADMPGPHVAAAGGGAGTGHDMTACTVPNCLRCKYEVRLRRTLEQQAQQQAQQQEAQHR